jgi:hypothetical protein
VDCKPSIKTALYIYSVAVSQAILRQLPSGATPPLVLSYSATDVPVLRVGLSGLSEQQLNDLGLNFVRAAAHKPVRQRAIPGIGRSLALSKGFAARTNGRTSLYPGTGPTGLSGAESDPENSVA